MQVARIRFNDRFPCNKNIMKMKKNIQPYNLRTNSPVNTHLIFRPSKAQNIQNLEKK